MAQERSGRPRGLERKPPQLQGQVPSECGRESQGLDPWPLHITEAAPSGVLGDWQVGMEGGWSGSTQVEMGQNAEAGSPRETPFPLSSCLHRSTPRVSA